MRAYTQILSAAVRCGPEATKWKTPYEVSTTYSAIDPITAWAHTVWNEDQGRITREHIEAMSDAIFRDGFERVKWSRIKNGKRRIITIHRKDRK